MVDVHRGRAAGTWAGRLLGTLALLSLAASAGEVRAEQRLTDDVATDPAAAELVFRDVENFLHAAEAIASGEEAAKALRLHYFDRATPGLKMFVEKYDLTVERLLAAMREYPGKYAALEETLTLLESQVPFYRQAYARLREVIPDAVFPPTYFLVGAHRGIGSGSIEGPLISIEKESAESIRGDLAATLVHEMVHMQQLAALGPAYFEIFSGEQRTLLALSLREGVATYVAERVTGGSEHKNLARDYLLANERELWLRFREQMLGTATGDWLWRRPDDPEQPPDVGYALGARIARCYYDNAEDKVRAVREMLAITDYSAFLAGSRYDGAGATEP